MLTLYFSPGACSMAAHIVLQESGEEYQSQRVNFAARTCAVSESGARSVSLTEAKQTWRKRAAI